MMITFIWLITLYVQSHIFHILVHLLVCCVWPRSAENFVRCVCLKKEGEKLDNLEKLGPEDKKTCLVCVGLYTVFSEQQTGEAVIL